MKPLLALGANEVVPEEFETALEIFARTLRYLLVPRDVTDRLVGDLRADGYGVLRSPSDDARVLGEANLVGGAGLEVLRVEPGSQVAGKSLRDSELRKQAGATVIALRREGDFTCNPPHSAVLEPGSVAVVFGTPEQLAAAARLFRPAESSATRS